MFCEEGNNECDNKSRASGINLPENNIVSVDLRKPFDPISNLQNFGHLTIL